MIPAGGTEQESRWAKDGAPRRRTGTLGRLLAHGQARLGGAVVLLVLVLAVAGPVIAPHDPLARDPTRQLLPPSLAHPFGTDSLGRDVFSQVIYGARPTLLAGLGSVALAAGVGVALGIFTGYVGGRVDLLVSALLDFLLSFPSFLLALAIVAVLGPGLGNATLAVGFRGIPTFARLARGEVLVLREAEYVQSARAAGASGGRIMLRTVLPNAAPTIIVMASLELPAAILMLAGLSFLGLGAQPPSLEWGRLMVGARDFLHGAPWLVNLPGLVILVTVLGFNLLGNALRDVLDPRLRRV